MEAKKPRNHIINTSMQHMFIFHLCPPCITSFAFGCHVFEYWFYGLARRCKKQPPRAPHHSARWQNMVKSSQEVDHYCICRAWSQMKKFVYKETRWITAGKGTTWMLRWSTPTFSHQGLWGAMRHLVGNPLRVPYKQNRASAWLLD